MPPSTTRPIPRTDAGGKSIQSGHGGATAQVGLADALGMHGSGHFLDRGLADFAVLHRFRRPRQRSGRGRAPRRVHSRLGRRFGELEVDRRRNSTESRLAHIPSSMVAGWLATHRRRTRGVHPLLDDPAGPRTLDVDPVAETRALAPHRIQSVLRLRLQPRWSLAWRWTTRLPRVRQSRRGRHLVSPISSCFQTVPVAKRSYRAAHDPLSECSQNL